MQKKMNVVITILLLSLLLPCMTFSQKPDWLLLKSTYELYANLVGVRIGDMNNDGLNDIVMHSEYLYNSTPENNYKIFIFTQKQSGGLNPPIKYNGGNGRRFEIGDMNGDGLNDIIFITNSGIGIYYQKSTGGFTSMVKVGDSSLDTFYIGDVNGDDKLDLISFDWLSLDYMIVYVQKNGQLVYHTQYPINISDLRSLKIGDLNSDGYNDIVLAYTVYYGSDYSRYFYIFYQDSSNPGFFLDPIKYTSATNPCSVAIADMDRDGRNDLVVLEREIYYQQDDGTLGSPESFLDDSYISKLNSLNIVDLNRDSRPDLVDINDNLVIIFFQQIDGTFNPNHFEYNDYYDGYYTSSLTVGDVNNDDRDDIIIANMNEYNGLDIIWGMDVNSIGIVVQNPRGGSKQKMGSYMDIEWGTVGNIGNVDIFYSIDNGENWEVIVNDLPSEPSDNKFNWKLPYVLSDQCLVKVVDNATGVKGENIWTFSIINDGNPHIIVKSPNGGESLVGESVYNIKWETIGSVGNVKIEYSIDNGSNWTVITSSTSNDGTFEWTVPNTLSNSCLIRVSEASDNVLSDTSDSTFSIIEPGSKTVNIISPNGGESLTAGSLYSITWQSTNISQVALAYSIDNGSNWIDIGTEAASAETFTWTVPMVSANQCLIRVRDTNPSGPSDVSNAVFSITYTGGPFITVLSPNGGEFLSIGTTHKICWLSSTASVGNVQIQYSINNGVSWNTIVSSTTNDGYYDWTVPNTPSGLCLLRIMDASDGSPSDTSDSIFTIGKIGATISITSPQNGDLWQVGSKHDIKWVSGSAVSYNVKLEYSTNNKSTWKTISSSTPNDGKYTWTIPNVPSTKCNVKISDVATGGPSNISFGNFSIVSGSEKPVISLNRNSLYFGWVKSSSAQTSPQTIMVNNGGAGTLKWYVAFVDDGDNDSESKWLKLSNTSGTQSGKIEFYIEPVGLNPGTYDALIKIYDNNASNSPQMVNVILNVITTGGDSKPFGSFETPEDGANVMSSIPVTGWALDDTGIDKVTIWRNAVAGEGKGEIYVGDAVLVDGARPDVEQAYSTFPVSYKAGWGYMMLTNFLPNGGNGTYTLHAYAKDGGGHQVKLGSKTITVNNAGAVKPFGAIDTPAQGGDASGAKFRNQGWVLTPMPNKIPVNGATIKVYVDGQNIGTCKYNILREDILTLFPGYANSSGALAYYDLDTTVYENKVHTLQWTATDSAGHTDGIGSRYFTVQNTGYNRQASNTSSRIPKTISAKTWHDIAELENISPDSSGAVRIKKGFNGEPMAISAGKDGALHIALQQDQRLEIVLNLSNTINHYGYLMVDNHLRSLPAGASLDQEKGIFYWQPGPAAFGKYPLVFISTGIDGNEIKKIIYIEIIPKNSRLGE